MRNGTRRRVGGRMLRPWFQTGRSGYDIVTLYREDERARFYVHQLVELAFGESPRFKFARKPHGVRTST